MFTPLRSVAAYAATVALGAWLVGLTVTAACCLVSASGDGSSTMPPVTWDDAVLLVAEVTDLTTARKVLPSMPRWKVTTFDAPLYTVVMLVVAVATAAADGDSSAVDWGFVRLTFAMLSLHLPAAYVLSWWASGRLTLAMKGNRERGGRRTSWRCG